MFESPLLVGVHMYLYILVGGVYMTPFSPHKNEHLVTVLAFCLHANDENAHAKRRLLNSETKLETLKTDT